ncbi:ferritin family protein [Sphingobium sp. Ant17]|uniref:ferritin family protein n=1 Tax=Sphingobium sp. Ant17 TaxID=1461752 RepID=UPI0004B65DE0|nr:ferritin family protein [Sphingobium sp. Ant17]
MTTGTDPGALPRYRSNLQGEVDGAAVYAALAESEADPKLAEVFHRLAAVEQAHGEFWRKRIEAAAAIFRLLPPQAHASSPGWRSDWDRLSSCRRSRPARRVAARPMTHSPRRRPPGFPATSDRMPC